jgi:excisionase family DNA binding protein
MGGTAGRPGFPAVAVTGGSRIEEAGRSASGQWGAPRVGEEASEPSGSRYGMHATMKTVFTTGEAAKICKVSQQTIIRCFDSGQLKGFRVPGSRFRRIPRDALYRFMKENNIPTDALESGRRRILVVDDDQAVVDLINDVLAKDGRFETRSVNNGFEAGMLAKEYRPDLIILDVMLPDINGQAVCELIKQDQTMRDIRIICISGMVEEDKIDELRASGADDFLHKPVDIDELIRRVCRLLEIEPATSA